MDSQRCEPCDGKGLLPCNGTNTGWCACQFCGGTGVYSYPDDVPGWMKGSTLEQHRAWWEDRYQRCVEWMQEWRTK